MQQRMRLKQTLASAGKTALAKSFNVRLFSDIHERGAEFGAPLPDGRKRRARHALIANTGVLFIHVPKNAGTSICRSLYGQEMEHRSIRYFAARQPELAKLPSVAVVRNPVDRFISAFRHARSGGGHDRTLADTFRTEYAAFRSLDDALDHVEAAKNWYQVDHIFRPQSWYVCNADGHIAVQRLFDMSNMGALRSFLFPNRQEDIPRVNASISPTVTASPEQIERIRSIYSQDYELLRSQAYRPARTAAAKQIRGRAHTSPAWPGDLAPAAT
ncbi:hypothetical protein ANI02nite_08360 [Acetobacter nitrogenifigens DSM 23921 = NBRC 105050]|uniref:Sulfotransferase family protein n=2 Tax=Acetobacter nitrogenifigens TaxID=285268 RepID=A0A511X7N6_9PROT|nr:hypothetical protein ANI02nite_08360 [Acetobacter nitrogenifigens DSM 23921 = NBRC 105050]